MNKGKNLAELAAELDRRANAKVDYVAPNNALTVGFAGEGENSKPFMDITGKTIVGINDVAHQQIASNLEIPRAYYSRMVTEAPELWSRNVNHWLRESDDRRMVRTLDGNARAFLSDRYLRVENEDIAGAVFGQLLDHPANPKALSTNVTDTKLYLQFLFPELEYEVKPGDIIHPGFVITNSEVGWGSYAVDGFFYRSFCENGCVWGSQDAGVTVRRRHVGGRVLEDAQYEVISDETQQKIGEALMSETRDIVNALADQKFIDALGDKLHRAASTAPMQNPEAGIAVLAKAVGLSDKERGQALVNLIQDRDYTLWGAANAVTKVANTTESYDRASDLEGIGSKILTLQLNQWQRIAETVEVPRTRKAAELAMAA